MTRATSPGNTHGAHLSTHSGIMQADAYADYNDLQDGAACGSHGQRKLFAIERTMLG